MTDNTPLNADDELRELVHIVQNADTTYDAIQFITADRKRVALEARIDELVSQELRCEAHECFPLSQRITELKQELEKL